MSLLRGWIQIGAGIAQYLGVLEVTRDSPRGLVTERAAFGDLPDRCFQGGFGIVRTLYFFAP